MAGFLDDMTPQQYGLLAAGLGILGNSRGQSFGQAVGIGGLQGLDAMAQMQQMRQMQQLRDAQEQRYRAMAEREQRKLDQEDATRAAYKGLDMSGSDEDLISKLSAIDPELALKWRMGQENSPKQFLPSSDGYMVGDLRKGTVTPVMVDGKTVFPAQYDPTTQGNITRNKELNQFTTIEGPTGGKISGFVKDLSGVSTQALTPEEQDAVINKLNQQPNALSLDEYEAMTSPNSGITNPGYVDKVNKGLIIGPSTADKKVQEEIGKAKASAKIDLNTRLDNLNKVIDEAKKGISALQPKDFGNGQMGFGYESGGMFPGLRESWNENVTNDPNYRALQSASYGAALANLQNTLKGTGQVSNAEQELNMMATGIHPTRFSSKENYEKLMQRISLAERAKEELKAAANGDFSELKETKMSDDDLLNKYLRR